MVGYTGHIICLFHVLNKFHGNSEPYPKPGKLFSFRSIAQVRMAVASGLLKLKRKKKMLTLF